MSYCKLIIEGRLGKDCEQRYLPDGKAVVNFSVAYDSGYGDNKQTVWVDCSMFGERAEKLAQYLVKGKSVLVDGKLQPINTYTKTDGTTCASLKMTVSELAFTGSKPAEDEGS